MSPVVCITQPPTRVICEGLFRRGRDVERGPHCSQKRCLTLDFSGTNEIMGCWRQNGLIPFGTHSVICAAVTSPCHDHEMNPSRAQSLSLLSEAMPQLEPFPQFLPFREHQSSGPSMDTPQAVWPFPCSLTRRSVFQSSATLSIAVAVLRDRHCPNPAISLTTYI